MTEVPDIHVTSGEIVALRLFDIAYAIDLALAEELWAARHTNVSRRSRLIRAPAKALAFGVAPLLLQMEPTNVEIESEVLSAQVSARLYDFGVVVLAIRFPTPNVSWATFSRKFNTIDDAIGGAVACDLWKTLLSGLYESIAKALTRPTTATLEEDYLLAIVTGMTPSLDAATLRERPELVELLSGENRPLSVSAKRDLLQRSFSYFEDDLVVLTWDRAFIYETRGDSDVADVIEVANAQLVEFRYYDELLDQELPHMYDHVEEARRTVSLFASRRFAHLARKLYMLVAEVTELTEKVDNALQVTEDVYLARVYTAALELFRVPIVSDAVDRKLAIIRDTYAALYDEASSRRAELLEVSVVVLIVIEIVIAIFRL